MEIKEHRLKAMKFGIERSLPSVEVEVNRDAVRDAVNVMVEALIPRQEFQPEKIVRYPASWWQGLKEVFFPKWLQRRFPVRYTEVELHGYQPSRRTCRF